MEIAYDEDPGSARQRHILKLRRETQRIPVWLIIAKSLSDPCKELQVVRELLAERWVIAATTMTGNLLIDRRSWIILEPDRG